MSATLTFISTILLAVISLGGTALMWFLGRGDRKLAQKVQDHDQWMKDADKAYERAEKRAEVAEAKCERCEKKLEIILAAFYGLLEDIEDQVIPMLMIPTTDHHETRVAMRVAVRTARDKAAKAGGP